MTLDELQLIKKALMPFEFAAFSREEWRAMKIKANQLINREITLKTMNPVKPKSSDPNMDSEMKMYGE